MTIIQRGSDGYYHPATEGEIQALVVFAFQNGRKLRVRGAGHSVAGAIYTDGYEGNGAPPPGHVEVMLDRYAKVTITPDPAQPGHAIAEVEAGCHLGRDPYDPTGTSTWANSLTAQLQAAGYALDDLGGITHQTVSGFLSTGSGGGSIMYSAHDNLVRLRLVDGTGTIHDVSRNDPDPQKRDLFFAAGVSMGLLGVISRVWLRVRPTYNIDGEQVTTATVNASIDLFGPGTAAKPSLAQFLTEKPYSRVMWWPQANFDRVQVWHATRVAPAPGFAPQPYKELGGAPEIASLGGSLFLTLVGNLGDLGSVPGKLGNFYRHLGDRTEPSEACSPAHARPLGMVHTLDDVLAWLDGRFAAAFKADPMLAVSAAPLLSIAAPLVGGLLGATIGALAPALAGKLTQLIRLLLLGKLTAPLQQQLGVCLGHVLSGVLPTILNEFVKVGKEPFKDTWMCGLPMDNQMDDQLWPTKFAEVWIPLDRAAEAMRRLRDYFAAGGDPKASFDHTGAFTYEIYSKGASEFWMSASYGVPVLRIDMFWFALNAGDPMERFYPPVWGLLKDLGFRPHWGKHLPRASAEWRSHYRAALPRMDDFLALRAQLDPGQVFVSDYWRNRLGIV